MPRQSRPSTTTGGKTGYTGKDAEVRGGYTGRDDNTAFAREGVPEEEEGVLSVRPGTSVTAGAHSSRRGRGSSSASVSSAAGLTVGDFGRPATAAAGPAQSQPPRSQPDSISERLAQKNAEVIYYRARAQEVELERLRLSEQMESQAEACAAHDSHVYHQPPFSQQPGPPPGVVHASEQIDPQAMQEAGIQEHKATVTQDILTRYRRQQAVVRKQEEGAKRERMINGLVSRHRGSAIL